MVLERALKSDRTGVFTEVQRLGWHSRWYALDCVSNMASHPSGLARPICRVVTFWLVEATRVIDSPKSSGYYRLLRWNFDTDLSEHAFIFATVNSITSVPTPMAHWASGFCLKRRNRHWIHHFRLRRRQRGGEHASVLTGFEPVNPIWNSTPVSCSQFRMQNMKYVIYCSYEDIAVSARTWKRK